MSTAQPYTQRMSGRNNAMHVESPIRVIQSGREILAAVGPAIVKAQYPNENGDVTVSCNCFGKEMEVCAHKYQFLNWLAKENTAVLQASTLRRIMMNFQSIEDIASYLMFMCATDSGALAVIEEELNHNIPCHVERCLQVHSPRSGQNEESGYFVNFLLSSQYNIKPNCTLREYDAGVDLMKSTKVGAVFFSHSVVGNDPVIVRALVIFDKSFEPLQYQTVTASFLNALLETVSCTCQSDFPPLYCRHVVALLLSLQDASHASAHFEGLYEHLISIFISLGSAREIAVRVTSRRNPRHINALKVMRSKEESFSLISHRLVKAFDLVHKAIPNDEHQALEKMLTGIEVRLRPLIDAVDISETMRRDEFRASLPTGCDYCISHISQLQELVPGVQETDLKDAVLKCVEHAQKFDHMKMFTVATGILKTLTDIFASASEICKETVVTIIRAAWAHYLQQIDRFPMSELGGLANVMEKYILKHEENMSINVEYGLSDDATSPHHAHGNEHSSSSNEDNDQTVILSRILSRLFGEVVKRYDEQSLRAFSLEAVGNNHTTRPEMWCAVAKRAAQLGNLPLAMEICWKGFHSVQVWKGFVMISKIMLLICRPEYLTLSAGKSFSLVRRSAIVLGASIGVLSSEQSITPILEQIPSTILRLVGVELVMSMFTTCKNPHRSAEISSTLVDIGLADMGHCMDAMHDFHFDPTQVRLVLAYETYWLYNRRTSFIQNVVSRLLVHEDSDIEHLKCITTLLTILNNEQLVHVVCRRPFADLNDKIAIIIGKGLCAFPRTGASMQDFVDGPWSEQDVDRGNWIHEILVAAKQVV
eukprot:CFRG0029T1